LSGSLERPARDSRAANLLMQLPQPTRRTDRRQYCQSLCSPAYLIRKAGVRCHCRLTNASARRRRMRSAMRALAAGVFVTKGMAGTGWSGRRDTLASATPGTRGLVRQALVMGHMFRRAWRRFFVGARALRGPHRRRERARENPRPATCPHAAASKNGSGRRFDRLSPVSLHAIV